MKNQSIYKLIFAIKIYEKIKPQMEEKTPDEMEMAKKKIKKSKEKKKTKKRQVILDKTIIKKTLQFGVFRMQENLFDFLHRKSLGFSCAPKSKGFMDMIRFLY